MLYGNVDVDVTKVIMNYTWLSKGLIYILLDFLYQPVTFYET